MEKNILLHDKEAHLLIIESDLENREYLKLLKRVKFARNACCFSIIASVIASAKNRKWTPLAAGGIFAGFVSKKYEKNLEWVSLLLLLYEDEENTFDYAEIITDLCQIKIHYYDKNWEKKIYEWKAIPVTTDRMEIEYYIKMVGFVSNIQKNT